MITEDVFANWAFLIGEIELQYIQFLVCTFSKSLQGNYHKATYNGSLLYPTLLLWVKTWRWRVNEAVCNLCFHGSKEMAARKYKGYPKWHTTLI